MLTAKLWFGGTSEHFVAIAGPEGDPTPDLVNGVARLMRGFLDPESDSQRMAIGPQVSLATLVEREAWQPMLGLLASKEDKNPREWYYMVVAYVRLKQRDAAVATLAEFREEHGKHFLVDAAAALIPPPQAAEAELEALDQSDLTPPEAPEPPPSSPRARYELTEEVITPTPPPAAELETELETEPEADADAQP
ncbi:MAG: hypothetical protein ACOCXJ_01465 [Planctomycetota bacterium]